MRRVLVVMATGMLSLAQTAPQPLVVAPPVPAEARMEQLLGREAVTVWAGLPMVLRISGMTAEGLQRARWEVRTADQGRRVGSFDMHVPTSSDVGPRVNGTRNFGVTPGAAATLAREGDGTYMAAWVVDGVRRSNVVQVKVDQAHELAEDPLVRVLAAEPAVKGSIPLLAITTVRRRATDPGMGPGDIGMATLVVDGKEYTPRAEQPTGRGQSPPGEWRTLELNLRQYEVKLDAAGAHVLKVVVAGNESAERKVEPGTPLGDAWDRATAALDAAEQGGGAKTSRGGA